MIFESEALRTYGGVYPLLEHFSRFYWLHPRLPWMRASLANRLWPSIRYGCREGLLYECESRPWLCPSPLLLDRLRGKVLRPLQWDLLKGGPPPHTSMIYRVAFALRELPDSFKVEVDEGVTERSPHPAWGALSQRVPDILVRAPPTLMPSLWLECERNIKRGEDYRKKLSEIPKDMMVFYITPQEKIRMKLLARWPDRDGMQKRLRVVNELGAMAWLKIYSAYARKLMADPQLGLLSFSRRTTT